MELISEEGTSLAKLSREIGRNDAYLQQYVKKGSPRILPEGARLKLAELLGVSSQALKTGRRERDDSVDGEQDVVLIPQVDVRLSAGPGAIDDDSAMVDVWPFSVQYLARVNLIGADLFVCVIEGDSMYPALSTGDNVMVNRSDTNPARPGIFALYDGGAVVVKRIEKIPATDPVTLRLISDNPLHGNYDVLASDTRIIGRVVWKAVRM